jgi:hypothetical protein
VAGASLQEASTLLAKPGVGVVGAGVLHPPEKRFA